jgi:uncharacterized protein involved in exopolysaccharide biosynthesis
MSNEEAAAPSPGKPEKNIPELRYVPLEYLQGIQQEEEEFDLVGIIKNVWDGRKLILISVIVFIIIGLMFALLSEEVYTSEVSLMPESEQSMSSLGGLGGLASRFGMGSLGQIQSDGIPANIYPRIANSSVFLLQVLDYEILLPDGSGRIKLMEYLKGEDESSSGSEKKWSLRNLFRSERTQLDEVDRAFAGDEKLERLTRMSRQDWEILRSLREQISINQDRDTGVVTIQVKFSNPLIAADLADQIVILLSEYITDYRTEKARRDVEFIEERFTEARTRFVEAQEELARFNDENRGQLTALARTQEQILQSNYNLTFNLYNSMAERLEDARIKLQEETPVLKVLEPAAIPDIRTSPKRAQLMVIFTILGGIVGTGIVIILPFLKQLKSRLQDEN